MLRLTLCLLCLLGLAEARPRRVIDKTVPDHFMALALDQQKLVGLLGNRVRANSEGLLENVDVTALLRPLNNQDDSQVNIAREFPGRFLDAASSAYEYNRDLQLRSLMDKVAGALEQSAARTYADNAQTLSRSTLQVAQADLTGLLNYYRVTGEASAYAAAQALSASLMKRATPLPQERALHLALTGLLQPILRLYRYSGEAKYLDFSKSIARGGAIPEIDDQTGPDELVESLTGFSGFAELYEVTGNATYLQPALQAWSSVAASRLSITGAPLPSPTVSEAKLDGAIGACAAASWMQFTFKLLRVTGKWEYGNQLEKTIYNQILAGQDARTGRVSPEVPLNGARQFTAKLEGANGRCVLAEAKALSTIPQVVWGRYENGIAINLYTPGRAFFRLGKHGLVQIYSEGQYPGTGQIQLHVEPSGKGQFQFPLELRVPKWASRYTVDVADLHLVGRPGEAVIVDRPWKSGDTVRVSMSIDVRTAEVVRDNAQYLIFERGPQVLALDRGLNTQLDDLQAAFPVPARGERFELFNYDGTVPRDWNSDGIYRVAGQVASRSQNLLLAPFADATDYRIALRKEPD